MTLAQIFLSPLACALLGAAFGALAGALLFWPRRPLGVGPMRVQGLLPARQAEMARRLGELVDQELVTAQDLAQAMDSEEFRAAVKDAVDKGVDLLLEGDSKWAAMLGAILRGKMRESLKQSLMAKLENLTTLHAETAAGKVVDRLRLGSRLEAHLAAMPAQELESHLKPLLKPLLLRLTLAAAALGFIIGWVQVLLLSL